MKLRPDFLIVGMQRSGTVWTAAILNSHPDVACFPNTKFHSKLGKNKIGDVDFFNTLASLEPGNESTFVRPISRYLTMYDKIFADLIHFKDTIPKKKFYRMMQKRYSEYCDKRRGNKKIVGENTADYVFHLDFIDSFYPDIKKICIIRDPKDKIVSWHFSLVNKGRRTEKELTEDFVVDYLKNRIVKEYQALLDYSGHVHCITYENLDTDAPNVVSGMLDYLEVKKSPKIIAHMIDTASFKKQTEKDSGIGREKGEEDRTSQIRKGIVGDWKNHMSEEMAHQIDKIVAPLRKEVFEKYKVTIV